MKKKKRVVDLEARQGRGAEPDRGERVVRGGIAFRERMHQHNLFRQGILRINGIFNQINRIFNRINRIFNQKKYDLLPITRINCTAGRAVVGYGGV